MRFSFLCLFLLFFIVPSIMLAGSPGTTAGRILQINADARAAGLGGAYCGLADNLSAVYWNPAGLCNIRTNEIAFSYADLYQEFKFSHLAFAAPLNNKTAVIGIGFSYLDSGEIQKTLATSRGFYLGNDGTFKAASSVITFSVGSVYLSNLYTGINIKRIQETIDTSSAQSFTLDMGLMYKTFSDRISIGFLASNFIGSLTLSDESQSLPMVIRLGSSMDLKNILVTADVSKVSEGDIGFHLGAEYPLANIIRIRMGFDSLSESKLTCGFGIKLGKQYFDYAFVQSKYLGLAHKLSLGVKFGSNKPRKRGKSTERGKDLWYFK